MHRKAGAIGHIGGASSICETLAALYFDIMHVDPENPDMEDRDRLVLSKGHAGPALYSALALKGYFPIAELDTLNRPQHPSPQPLRQKADQRHRHDHGDPWDRAFPRR